MPFASLPGSPGEAVTIGDALRAGSARLRAAGLQSADLEAAVLLGMATDFDRLGLITRTAVPLDTAQWAAYDALLGRREGRTPLQYLTGEQEFMSLAFAVSPVVLIPRPETEHLVEAVLDLEEDAGSPPPGAGRLAADVGTGSGAIAVALASYVTTLRVVATDISEAALALARANAERHAVADRVAFRAGPGLGALAALGEPLDYLVSNPPYIPTGDLEDLEPEVRDWEPREALDGGPDGLLLIRELAGGGDLVRPGGHLLLEVMAGQAPQALAVLEAAGAWTALRTVADFGGHERVVIARRR